MATALEHGGVRGVDADLDVGFAHVEQLRDLAADMDKARDNDRLYDFSIRWGVLLSGRLQRLSYYYRNGALLSEQVARYQALCVQLRDSAPMADELGLPRAQTAIDDLESGTAASPAS